MQTRIGLNQYARAAKWGVIAHRQPTAAFCNSAERTKTEVSAAISDSKTVNDRRQAVVSG
jgi:hypothetical protein